MVWYMGCEDVTPVFFFLNAATLVLLRELCLDVQGLGSAQDKVGVLQEPTANSNQVGLLLLQDFLSLLTVRDDTHGHDVQARHLPLDLLCKRHLVTWEGLDLLLGRVATGRDMEDIHTGVLDPFRDLDRLSNVPRGAIQMLNKISGRNSEQDGLLCWKVLTDSPNDLQQESGPVLERSTITIRTLVADRGKELMDQVTVRTVDLDRVQPSLGRTGRCCAKGLDSLFDLFDREFTGDMMGLIPLKVGTTTGSDHIVLPVCRLWQRLVVCLDRCLRVCTETNGGKVLVFPVFRFVKVVCCRRVVASSSTFFFFFFYLSSSVSKLDAKLGALSMHKVSDPLQSRDLLIIPNTSIGRGDATLGNNGGSLGQDQARAMSGKGSKMDEMVVSKETVLARELTHGGHNESVGQGEILDLEGLEQQGDLVGIGQGGVNGSEVGSGCDGLFDEVTLLRVLDTIVLVEGNCVGQGRRSVCLC